jgi:hypothetical protein
MDHLIGLYTSALIKDDGCLEIGIGKLGNALASSLIFRHKDNENYCTLMEQMKVQEKFSKTISEVGSLTPFTRGLYASTEMFSDEYLQLYKDHILKKRVYDHLGLQKLVNSQRIQETFTPEVLDLLLETKIINPQLTLADVEFLQAYGIFKVEISFEKNSLILPTGEVIPADLSIEKAKQKIILHCLGDRLKSGKIMHSGFFFGSVDFYSTLHQLSVEELKLIEMSPISRTNRLLWSLELLELQRQNARFVNSALMITLLGGVISDGLNNYQELSGVGGQYDFVSMASQLKGARSIINCRSTRKSKNTVESNIVWTYSNSTIPRYLRDFVVTEYGIADCRGKIDADVIKAILNITDSRFQPELLKNAKQAGKISQDYQIPSLFTANYPETLEKILHESKKRGYCQPYPFGSDLTQDEEVLARALLYLKNASKLKLLGLIVASIFNFQSDSSYDAYLQRMKLKSTKGVKLYLYKKLLIFVLYLRGINSTHNA